MFKRRKSKKEAKRKKDQDSARVQSFIDARLKSKGMVKGKDGRWEFPKKKGS